MLRLLLRPSMWLLMGQLCSTTTMMVAGFTFTPSLSPFRKRATPFSFSPGATTTTTTLLAKRRSTSSQKKIESSRSSSVGGAGAGAGFGGNSGSNSPLQTKGCYNLKSTTSRNPSSEFEAQQQHQQHRRRPDPPLLSTADMAKLNTLRLRQKEQEQHRQQEQRTIHDANSGGRSNSTENEEEQPRRGTAAIRARQTRRHKWSQRSMSAELTALYSKERSSQPQEYDQHSAIEQQRNSTSRQGQLLQVSKNPLIFTIDGFIDPDACQLVQNDATGCFDLLFPEKVADLLFNGQESEMDGLLFNAANSREHDAVVAHPSTIQFQYPDGLHMDTNNQCMFRHVTCILYLNDVPVECGGATVFPLARTLPDDPALAAARRLLDQKLSHTRSRACAALDCESDAHFIEARGGQVAANNNNAFSSKDYTETAIRIQPRAGRLLIFFSRDGKGYEDPRSWHAGERIQAGRNGSLTEKRILTLFKEVDYGIPVPPDQIETTFEAYLAPMVEEQRKWLEAKAHLQQALLQKIV